MLALERSLHETFSTGPEERQLFYIQKQVAPGLRPPPYPWQAVVQYILVLQWPADSLEDYDALIAMEGALEGALPVAHGFVDGHDIGSGEMNIFVYTDDPLEAFRDAATYLGADPRWAKVRAAYRPAEGDRYVVVWPDTLQDFSVL